ncbi:MAG: fatty acid desaturase, partial [Rhizobiales bacterium]|nr:fatty acid desaturase [Hyphomicrobiales bacterium]
YFAFDMGFKDGRVFGFMKVVYLVTIIGFALVNLGSAIIFIILPFAWIYPAINYWTDCVDHAGRLEVGDDLYKSRNFIIHKSIRWMLFPRNDCYHLIHHLFPSVPSHQLEAAHDELMTDWSYAEAMQYLGNVPQHRLMVVL